MKKLLGPTAGCFDGGAFDGRYIYFIPLYSGLAVRFDTHRQFNDPSAWHQFDLKPHGGGMYVGAVFDGRHLYYCAYQNDAIVRFDATRDFTDAASWQSYRCDHTKGLRTNGFDGGFFDGRFVYFIPFVHGSKAEGYTFHSNFLRYDPLGGFNDPKSWDAHDASKASGLDSVGYNAGAFDGRYFYCAPWRRGAWNGTHWRAKPGVPGIHGTILRCDTLGNNGSFSLRYCDYGHNGGLNAAVPGPSFLVNTESGVRSVAAHRVLPPGRHHLKGVYDGKRIRLWIDGKLAAERVASGRIVNNDLPVTVGRIESGIGQFRGVIENTEWSATPSGSPS
jgi:hypothetical protein